VTRTITRRCRRQELADGGLGVPGVVDFEERPPAEDALGVDGRCPQLSRRLRLRLLLLQFLAGNLDDEVEQVSAVAVVDTQEVIGVV